MAGDFKYTHPAPDTLQVQLMRYFDGKLAVQLMYHDAPYTTLSVNTEDKLEPNEFVVKGYSENAGLAKLERYNGMFIDTGKRTSFGFIKDAEIWRLSPDHVGYLNPPA